MLPILLKDNKIDDIYIQKFSAINKAEKLISILTCERNPLPLGRG